MLHTMRKEIINADIGLYRSRRARRLIISELFKVEFDENKAQIVFSKIIIFRIIR